MWCIGRDHVTPRPHPYFPNVKQVMPWHLLVPALLLTLPHPVAHPLPYLHNPWDSSKLIKAQACNPHIYIYENFQVRRAPQVKDAVSFVGRPIRLEKSERLRLKALERLRSDLKSRNDPYLLRIFVTCGGLRTWILLYIHPPERAREEKEKKKKVKLFGRLL